MLGLTLEVGARLDILVARRVLLLWEIWWLLLKQIMPVTSDQYLIGYSNRRLSLWGGG